MSLKFVFLSAVAFTAFCASTNAQSRTPADTLSYYRGQIDKFDKEIVDILGKRMEAARIIGVYKEHHQIGVVQSNRFNDVLNGAIRHGKDCQLSEDFIRALYADIHKEAIRQEEELKKKN